MAISVYRISSSCVYNSKIYCYLLKNTKVLREDISHILLTEKFEQILSRLAGSVNTFKVDILAVNIPKLFRSPVLRKCFWQFHSLEPGLFHRFELQLTVFFDAV